MKPTVVESEPSVGRVMAEPFCMVLPFQTTTQNWEIHISKTEPCVLWVYPGMWGHLDSGNLNMIISDVIKSNLFLFMTHTSFMTLLAVTVAQLRVNTQPVCISLAIHLRSLRQPRTSLVNITSPIL